MKQTFLFAFICLLLANSCASKKELYPDRLEDKNNTHVYVNDTLDFSLRFFDIIKPYERQTVDLKLEKTSVPVVFQNHLKKNVKKNSEVLFQAYRTSHSDENIVAILYKNKEELGAFSEKIKGQLLKITPTENIKIDKYQTVNGFLIGSKAYQDLKKLGSDFMQKRAYNQLTYSFLEKERVFKGHEFHVPFNEKMMLRLIWIADVEKTTRNTKGDWEFIDRQNHHLELFSLTDSAKFRLKEIVPNDPFTIARTAFQESGYMGAFEELSGYEKTVEKKGTPPQKSLYYQAMMTYASFMGNHKMAMQYQDKAFGAKPPTLPDSVFQSYAAVNAAEYILQNIGNQRVVMFNEAHGSGQQRAFLRDILRGCYEKGFRYLSVEDLDDDSLQLRGYPLRRESGFYCVEPTFSQVLREALDLGFIISGHDVSTDKREEGQAKKIAAILARDPNAKIVVWAGHAHIHEQSAGGDVPRMAQYFKKMTGIDPFTVETTKMSEHSTPDFESGYYRAAMKKWQSAVPFVAKLGEMAFVSPNLKGVVDVQVFFPRTTYHHDYPNWLGNDTLNFCDLMVDRIIWKDKILLIFLEKEYVREIENAIPVMAIPLSRDGIFKLFLKPERYVAVVRDAQNWEFLYRPFEVLANEEAALNALTTKAAHQKYLTDIFNADQKVRQDVDDATAKYGHGSKEYAENVQLQIQRDSINLNKIRLYVKKFGYPALADYGEIPAATPWAVIHHSGDVAARNALFPTLHKAWREKNIKSSAFIMYLNRNYRLLNGVSFKPTYPATPESEIEQLIKALGY